MGTYSETVSERRHWPSIALSGVLAFVMLAIMVQTLRAQESPVEPLNIDTSEKVVNHDQARPGEKLSFSVIIRNSSASPAFDMAMTDTLPASLTLLPETAGFAGGVGALSTTVDTVLWNGAINPESQVTVSFQALLSESLDHGDTVTNTAVIAGSGLVVSRTAATAVVTDSYQIFFPLVFRPLPEPHLAQLGRTTGNNTWTLGWSVQPVPGVTGFQLQESQRSDFVGATTINIGGASTSQIQRTHVPTFENFYHYRIRAVSATAQGPWSNVVTVMANYRDDFNDPASGWAVRRMSYLEKSFANYSNGRLVVLVDDRWDWLVASPLVRAPAPPYVIEFQARAVDASNLISGGPVVGGDWNGGACPDFGNIYQTTNCFNQFYNFNQIFHGPLKLLLERVDQLYWCPTCGGSPLKRLGPSLGEVEGILPNGQAENWHTYRLEVRSTGLRYYVDGASKGEFADSTYVNSPYFGIFASTDEYKPSIWQYEYFEVRHLD
jgi:uncharacterized repeat protein (TIGR01451 family)